MKGKSIIARFADIPLLYLGNRQLKDIPKLEVYARKVCENHFGETRTTSEHSCEIMGHSLSRLLEGIGFIPFDVYEEFNVEEGNGFRGGEVPILSLKRALNQMSAYEVNIKEAKQ